VTTTSDVIVDGTPPTSVITDPVNGQTITSTTYLVSGTASDDVQIDRVEISTDNGTTWYTATGTTSWVYTWDVPIGSGVTHTLRTRAVDLVGKIQSPSAWVTVTVDNVPPTVTIHTPENGIVLTGTLQTITGTASSNSTYVEISTDGGATWATATGITSWQYAWILPTENGITHTLMARSSDSIGRIGTSDPVTVTVDTVAPEVLNTEPPDGDDLVFTFADIVITFTEQVDPTSLNLIILPDPGGWSYTWNLENTQVTAKHSNRFTLATTYHVIIVVEDTIGNLIAPPYEWTFTTSVAEFWYPLISR
jgi:hypothetical protein